ncbi:uncharacterized protein L969DRAFT_15696 [Mixia osmundae IAM 14324]|uniref:BZIP domain-containing protein n=1 Tax=Mixia osmundae (strain CBS 9802 / IAM 14324 / JCM 22182 / KY 12970) TaxID=764103 RepID=G7DTP9_MIXOS|nr:uncharacterized protein L969DRAFT_15696 [Mixia osmundae IAM 14324]KEI41674.1 hypothetical protein L969DRAFT_15696 [Mixia osmundae IAM 14324]GAA93959.1 hypothetical protein E5Q_00605 [Mixia osmundae IAM 14324]
MRDFSRSPDLAKSLNLWSTTIFAHTNSPDDGYNTSTESRQNGTDSSMRRESSAAAAAAGRRHESPASTGFEQWVNIEALAPPESGTDSLALDNLQWQMPSFMHEDSPSLTNMTGASSTMQRVPTTQKAMRSMTVQDVTDEASLQRLLDGLKAGKAPEIEIDTPHAGPLQNGPSSASASLKRRLPLDAPPHTLPDSSRGVRSRRDSVSTIGDDQSSVATPAELSIEEANRRACEEDRRRRNTAASARFRAKKKQREAERERTAKDMRQQIAELETELVRIKGENEVLRQLVVSKGIATPAIATADLPNVPGSNTGP